MQRLMQVSALVLAAGIGGVLACSKPEKTLESGRTFMTTVYNDTTIEQFSRTTKRLEGTLVQGQDTLSYTAMLGDSGQVTSIRLSDVAHRGHDRLTAGRNFLVPKGTVPLMAGSGALFEQVLRRVRAVGGDSVSVPVMFVGASDDLNVLTISGNGPDSLIAVPQDGGGKGNEFHIAIDSAWRITGYVLPLSGMVMRAL